MDDLEFEAKLNAARRFYNAQLSVQNPFLKSEVFLDSRGFSHLQCSNRRERSRDEQALRFALLPHAITILKTATTAQEHRLEFWRPKMETRRSNSPTEIVEYWGFTSIYVKEDIGVRVIVQKIGNAKPHFLSVMADPIPAKSRLGVWKDVEE